MKIKYCERCGLFLGLVKPYKEILLGSAKHKIDKERDKKRKKSAHRTKTQELEKQKKRFRLSEKFKRLLTSSANTTAKYQGCLRQER